MMDASVKIGVIADGEWQMQRAVAQGMQRGGDVSPARGIGEQRKYFLAQRVRGGVAIGEQAH